MGYNFFPVLVTGATGNVGRATVQALEQLHIPWVGASTDPVRAQQALGGRAKTVELDFNRPETFAPALQGCRGLFLVRPPAIAQMRRTLLAFVDHALREGIQHITFLSVAGAERQRWVPHHAVEKHLTQLHCSTTLLRPGFFAQNLGDAYRLDILQANEVVVPAGRGRVAFVDVRDIAELGARSFVDSALQGLGVTLTGPQSHSFSEVAAILSETLQRTIRYRAISIPGYWKHQRQRNLPALQVAIQTLLHVGLRFGNAEFVDPNLERLLARPPRTLHEYVRDHAHLWQPPE